MDITAETLIRRINEHRVRKDGTPPSRIVLSERDLAVLATQTHFHTARDWKRPRMFAGVEVVTCDEC